MTSRIGRLKAKLESSSNRLFVTNITEASKLLRSNGIKTNSKEYESKGSESGWITTSDDRKARNELRSFGLLSSGPSSDREIESDGLVVPKSAKPVTSHDELLTITEDDTIYGYEYSPSRRKPKTGLKAVEVVDGAGSLEVYMPKVAKTNTISLSLLEGDSLTNRFPASRHSVFIVTHIDRNANK